MTESIYDLIQEYRAAVGVAVDLLRREFATERPLEAWIQRGAPMAGDLRGGGSYRFHGVGCEVDLGDYSVDFDFGPADVAGGFDAWRLWRFAKQFPQRFGQFGEVREIEMALNRLEKRGEILKRQELPSPHLFWLKTPDDHSAPGD